MEKKNKTKKSNLFNWTVRLTAVCSMIRVHLETKVYKDFKYSPHHTTAVDRQSGEGIINVCHILGTPQPLCHSTGARPGSTQQEGWNYCHTMCQGSKIHWYFWEEIMKGFHELSLTRVLGSGWWHPHTLPTDRLLHRSQASFVHRFLF